eukprot:SAG31_NODE_2398_length_5781_cov_6.178061_1_plen_137_part_10
MTCEDVGCIFRHVGYAKPIPRHAVWLDWSLWLRQPDADVYAVSKLHQFAIATGLILTDLVIICLHLGKFWDEFGIQDTDMIGFWEPEIPVTVVPVGADGPIHATAYVSKGKKTLVSIGSWSNTNATFKLDFDWNTLG